MPSILTEDFDTYQVRNGLLIDGDEAANTDGQVPLDGWYWIAGRMEDGEGPFETQDAAIAAATKELTEDPMVDIERRIKAIPHGLLGALLKDYIADSNHNSWDGWEDCERLEVIKFFEDLLIYHEATEGK